MSQPVHPIGPGVLGIELSADASVSSDGWLVRELTTPVGLDGPPGILQGGVAAGVTVDIARAADRFGAPLTALHARLHAPTPLGARLQARVRAAELAAHYEVELRDGDRLLVSAEVELAGHEPAPRAFDLAELATVALPDPRPQTEFPTCWVCGPAPTHPAGQRLHPRYHAPGRIVVPWVADDDLGDEASTIDPIVIAGVLDCPTAWAVMGHVHELGHRGALLVGYHLQMFRDAPVMEPLRTVAKLDTVDGRKLHARGALIDEEGVIYAVSSALHLSVPDVPTLAPRNDP